LVETVRYVSHITLHPDEVARTARLGLSATDQDSGLAYAETTQHIRMMLVAELAGNRHPIWFRSSVYKWCS
jgi:hypothetical protein